MDDRRRSTMCGFKTQIIWSPSDPRLFATMEVADMRHVLRFYHLVPVENTPERKTHALPPERTEFISPITLPFPSENAVWVNSIKNKHTILVDDKTKEKENTIRIITFSIVDGRIEYESPLANLPERSANMTISVMTFNQETNQLLCAGKQARGTLSCFISTEKKKFEDKQPLHIDDQNGADIIDAVLKSKDHVFLSMASEKPMIVFVKNDNMRRARSYIKTGFTPQGMSFSPANQTLATFGLDNGFTQLKIYDTRGLDNYDAYSRDLDPVFKHTYNDTPKVQIHQIIFSRYRPELLASLTTTLMGDSRDVKLVVQEFHRDNNKYRDRNKQDSQVEGPTTIFHKTDHTTINLPSLTAIGSAHCFRWCPTQMKIICWERNEMPTLHPVHEHQVPVISPITGDILVGGAKGIITFQATDERMERFRARLKLKYGHLLAKNMYKELAAKAAEKIRNYSSIPDVTSDPRRERDFAQIWKYLIRTKKADIEYYKKYHLNRNRITTGIAGTLMNKYRTGMKEESETTEGYWQKSRDDDTCIFTSRVYTSDPRRRVIELCGYYDPLYHTPKEISNKIDELLLENPTKAAAYALFCRQKWRAIQILKDQRQEKMTYIVLAISGFNNNFGSDWHQEVDELLNSRSEANDPYVRAMLGFLVEEYGEYAYPKKVLNLAGLDVDLKIAFAAIYLSDDILPRYLRTLATELDNQKSLMAVALSGFEDVDDARIFDGFEILYDYYQTIPDILSLQTIIYIIFHGYSYSAFNCSKRRENLFTEWTEDYTQILQDNQLYNDRCEFEHVLYKIIHNPDEKNGHRKHPLHSTMYELCQFCKKPISDLSKGERSKSRGRNPPNATECMCQNNDYTAGALDRRVCSICQFLVTQTSETPPIRAFGQAHYQKSHRCDWVLCLSCGHGGHTPCLKAWFMTSEYCPFDACKCICKT
ncbi:Oidioi.mRNA.OKI2018_I69.chr1.g1150.t1.cds [Oikopleura dioica]|uniref:Oidioi.mRNA.OKI2018_I69.chr1.g1150.t1.cds n=1 Tax=Oikopleura dioica TaxID=34765 RepID=A0ABN7SRA3_OIKDI|nr:Oidioi.mRNA.OKI2018_I69.chr1.g1150.t1.cds [Oikopleura dioica]